MTVTVEHEDKTGAAANPSVAVDGPKWDKPHTFTQTQAGVLGNTDAGAVGVLSAANARSVIGVDAAGTDNSTDVTLNTASYEYLSISGQEITLGPIDLDDDTTGTLPGTKFEDGSVTAAKLADAGGSLSSGGPAILKWIGGPMTFERWMNDENAGNGTTDCRDAMAAMLTAGVEHLHLGAGVYRFDSAIPTIGYPLKITGVSMSRSVLRTYQTSGSFLHLYSTSQNPSCLFENFTCWISSTATLTAYLWAQSHTQDYAPDFLTIRNLNLTGGTAGSLAAYGILLDGSARQGAGSGLLGIRNVEIDRVEIFNTTTLSIDIRQGRSVRIDKAAAFATGTGGNNSVQISGPSSSYPSDGVQFEMANLLGDFTIDHADNTYASGTIGDVFMTANSDNTYLAGILGDITANGNDYYVNGFLASAASSATSSNGRISARTGSSSVDGSATNVTHQVN